MTREEREIEHVKELLEGCSDAARNEILNIIGEKNRKLSVKYGLVFEEGSDEEDSYDSENVANDLKTHIPVPHYREDLSMTLEKASKIAGIPVDELPSQPSGNLLLEGDNLHWLTVLQQTHKGKIDVIYIDPPYGTGSDGFSYNDKFVKPEDDWRHSKWLSFMNHRLEFLTFGFDP